LDLRDVLNEAALMLQFQARENQTRFLVEPGPVALPVRADSAQLKQVVMNLALNSLHAMEAAVNPVLHIGAGRDLAGIYFTVRDNGAGIPAGVIGRIFDPFFTTKGPDKGTGLGLSICHSIIRQHGGEIKVWSKPGEGTSFTVRLPAKPEVLGNALGDSHQPFHLGPAGSPSQRRVLVVEDQLVIRNFIKEAVRHLYGCIVDEAADGREGLAKLERHEYDLIISDIRMPQMTGPEFYLRLKDSRPHQAAKVVFVTGHVGQDQLQEDIARWGVPVLAKPFTVDRLARMCDSRMNSKIAGVA
jgi:CheY-like chemotaxis protein